MKRRSRHSLVAALVVAIGMTSVAGAPALAQDEPPPSYYLPAQAGTELIVSQGNGDTAFRTDDQEHAFDFIAADGPARFPVVAARGGTVIGVRTGIRGGRCREPGGASQTGSPARRPECWRQVNLILIDHGDGTSGLYLHLRPGRSPVQTGDVVSTGQPIGAAGNTGWTDEIGLQFQVQRTPAWNERGRGGWFLTESQPVSFSDPDVLALRPDGIPQTGDSVVSGGPVPIREPFRLRRRPVGLPATVPFEVNAQRGVSDAYLADSPDGYGLHFATVTDATVTADPLLGDPGTIVRPLFGGELAYAGCATGTSSTLGRTVAINLDLDGATYTAVLGHLSEIEPALLDLDPAAPSLIIGPNEFLGRYGVVLPPDQVPALECPEGEPAGAELFAAILQDATVTPDGEIIGGTPISPEPLVGALGYEGFDWWAGPLTATTISEEPGRPRSRWNDRTPAHASHVVFGDPIPLVARVVDVTDIRQVRFRAYYPSWPRAASGPRLASFDPAHSWRQLAVCAPPTAQGEEGDSGCRWNGNPQDAVVTYPWDPSAAPAEPEAPWLPRARPAITSESTECVPVSVAVEVVDGAGHVSSQIGSLPLPTACDEQEIDRSQTGRVLYLDPLVPPRAPGPRGDVDDRALPPVVPDPLNGAIIWRDRSDNEDGFNVYARRSWFEADCSITNGPWQLVTEVPEDTRLFRPQHTKVARSIERPQIEGVPGSLNRWEYSVSAFNEAGETGKALVGGFVRGQAFCDLGVQPPPDEGPPPDEEPAP